MSALKYLLACLLLGLSSAASAALPAPGEPGAIKDKRYCGEPKRNPDGSIYRDPKVLSEFKKVFPCPPTLKPGACRGWQMNHTLPLSRGGCDSVENLTWLPNQVKTCKEPWCLDRWELKYHAMPRQPVLTP